MTPLERLLSLSRNDMEVWYPHVFRREVDEVGYYTFLELDPTKVHRLGVNEYKIEHVTEDCIYTLFRHL